MAQPCCRPVDQGGNVANGGMEAPDIVVEPSQHTIFQAAGNGNKERLRQLLEEGDEEKGVPPVSANETDENGRTGLHWASLNDETACMKLLIHHGAEINVGDKDGHTPLQWACTRYSINAVRLLIASGADVMQKNSLGYDALMHAAQYDQPQSAELLMDAGASVEVRDAAGHTALHWAAYEGSSRMINYLLSMGADIRAVDRENMTALHWAANRNHARTCQILISYDSDLDAVDSFGKTPLDLAQEKGHASLVSILRSMQKKSFICPRHKNPWLFIIQTTLVLLVHYQIYSCSLQETYNIFQVLLFFLMFFISVPASMIAAFSDPGFITDDAVSTEESEIELLETGERKKPKCPSCKTVRPERSKHCTQCRRCVKEFDHHCGWVNNCIGAGNRRAFIVFVASIFFAIINAFFIILMYIINKQSTISPSESIACSDSMNYVVLIFLALMIVPIFSIVASSLHSVWINLTTNEKMNCYRYRYLKDEQGTFYNKYDKGPAENCKKFWKL